ncbi:MAG: glycosyltransferase family 2 protein [Novosphingobium sp.]|uniref:glycosyltransferase family 2 protein n=1 Tax=Novosphingobium sp. TaxID=1874826 RepID=UPI0012C71095|nr:glycosyltransferase family 2 protein [Novosphingobium sp.]MPS70294.1 glycosyltransferase family 2 protein [Novosphingobium sp.]
MPRASITVVVPAYQAGHTIERTVRSVFGQPHVDTRVIVVVDDTGEETRSAAQSIADTRLSVIVNEANLGAQKSRNRGLALVETDYVMFLDGDDFVMGDLFRGLLDAVENGADVAFGPWLRYNEAAPSAELRRERYSSAEDLLDRWLVRRRWTPPCAVLWRTDFVRSIGGWDEAVQRNQDGEIVCRAALAGARLTHSDRGCGVYVQHDSPLRISANRSTFGDLIDVAESLLRRPSDTVPDEKRARIIGEYFYWLADSAFRRGDMAQGRRALQRSLSLGGKGAHLATVPKLGAAVFGLEGYRKAVAWLTPRR